MAYRFLEISDVYDAYIDRLDIPEQASYDDMMKIIADDCYCESDYIHRYLRSDYGIETMLVYYNYTRAQEKWDGEPDKDPYGILLRQIRSFDPDVIYVSSLRILSREIIQEIRRMLHHPVHFTGYHFTWVTEQTKEVLPEYEVIFTGSNYSAELLRQSMKNVKVVRHAFEPSVLDRLSRKPPVNRVGFIGSIFIGRSGHTNRIDLLAALRRNHIGFDYYGQIYGSFLSIGGLKEHMIHEPARLPSRIRTEQYLKKICKPSQFGLDYYNCLSRYPVNLNIHAEIAGTGAGNMRMFEVTGVGSCLVTDYREENALLFEDGKEMVVFRNREELADKVKYLMAHPEETRKIAKNGQKRTLSEYNYRNKTALIDKYIREVL